MRYSPKNKNYYNRIEHFSAYPEERLFYIHAHQDNIGKVYNMGPSLSSSLMRQKGRLDKNIISQYKKSFKSQFDLTGMSKKVLNTLFNNNINLTEFNEQLRQAIESSVSVDKIAKLLELRGNANVLSKEAFTNEGLNLKEYNKLLEVLSETAKMIRGEQGGALAVAILENKRKGKTLDLFTAGSNLQQSLQKFLSQNEGQTFSIEQSKHVVELLNSLAASLIDNKTSSSKENLTKDSFKKICDNIYSSGFAEVIAGDIYSDSKNLVIQQMKNVGKKGTFVPLGSDTQRKVSQGKADIKYENVQFTFQSNSQNNLNRIYNLILDISIKNYLDMTWGYGRGGYSKHKISGGSSGNLFELLDKTFITNRNKYFAYNIIVHKDAFPKDILNLQDSILRANALNFFAGASNNDFNNFIIANQQVISIWEVINQVLMSNSVLDNHFLYLTVGNNENNFLNGLNKISRTGKTYVNNGNIIASALKRTKNTLNEMKKTTIKAHMNLLQIISKERWNSRI